MTPLRTNRRDCSDNLTQLELVEDGRLTSCIETNLYDCQWKGSIGEATLGQTIKMPAENVNTWLIGNDRKK